MRYRIKIEERNNGETKFIPQAVTGRISGGWIKRFDLLWENIIRRGNDGFDLTSSVVEIHDSEENALEIIEKYKEYLSLLESKKIKKISYKNIY